MDRPCRLFCLFIATLLDYSGKLWSCDHLVSGCSSNSTIKTDIFWWSSLFSFLGDWFLIYDTTGWCENRWRQSLDTGLLYWKRNNKIMSFLLLQVTLIWHSLPAEIGFISFNKFSKILGRVTCAKVGTGTCHNVGSNSGNQWPLFFTKSQKFQEIGQY